MVHIKKLCYLLSILLSLNFVLNSTTTAQEVEEKKQATTPGPSGLDMVKVGTVEITPSKANLVLTHKGNDTHLCIIIRFKIINNSMSDIKVIFFRRSINVTDNLGEILFTSNPKDIKSSGILLSDKSDDRFFQAFSDDKGKFITLSPKQVIEGQLTAGYFKRIEDKDLAFYRNHRPKSVTLTGTLGIIYIDNSTELRAFSFSDMPIIISTR